MVALNSTNPRQTPETSLKVSKTLEESLTKPGRFPYTSRKDTTLRKSRKPRPSARCSPCETALSQSWLIFVVLCRVQGFGFWCVGLDADRHKGGPERFDGSM